MSDERRFEATRSRLDRARREGDLPRSHDLVATAAFGSASLGLSLLLAPLSAAARAALAGATGARAWSPLPYLALAAAALSLCVFSCAGTLVASLVQSGGFAMRAPGFKLSKLDPAAGARRIFSRDALLAGAKAMAIALAVGAAAFPIARDASGAAAAGEPPGVLAQRTAGALRGILAAAIAVGLAFGVTDAVVERMKWRRRLRMSFDELKRDQRQSEGDPLFRSRRRSAHRSLLRGSIERVSEAAFVVVNPTHVAVALAYRPPEIAVPQVIVRALAAAALEVRRRAEALGLPIVEDAALARALLAGAHVDQFIPKDLYAAVARIVAELLAAGRIAPTREATRRH